MFRFCQVSTDPSAYGWVAGGVTALDWVVTFRDGGGGGMGGVAAACSTCEILGSAGMRLADLSLDCMESINLIS